jgi:hypothetical protein
MSEGEQSLRMWAVELAVAVAVGFAVAASAAESPSVTLNGQLQYETFGYPDGATRGDRWENFFQVELRSRGQLTSTLDFEAEVRVVADDAEYTAGVYSLRNANVRRPYLSVTTAAINYRPIPELRVSVGKQIVNWDIFDGIQPANLLSNLDQSDPFRAVAQGVNGIGFHYQPGAVYLDLTVVPLAFTPSRSPQDRWIIIPEAVPYHQHVPPVQLEETQAGLRVGGRLGDVEASMFGYVGRDLLPLFVLNFERLTVESRSPRLRAGGMNASYPLGERLLLRLETVYLQSPDRSRGDFLNSLVGGEYALGDWRVVLGYLRQDRTARPSEQVLSQGERVFFQSFVSGEVRYDHGPWGARLRGGYDFRGEFTLLEPEVAYRLWQPLRAVLGGALILSGRENTYFQRIRHEDRLGLRLELQF